MVQNSGIRGGPLRLTDDEQKEILVYNSGYREREKQEERCGNGKFHLPVKVRPRCYIVKKLPKIHC